MANRSDRGSVLPRKYKRMISLMCADAHRSGEMRRLFMNAHAVEQAYSKKRLVQKADGLDDQGTILTTQAVIVENLPTITKDKSEDGNYIV